VKSPTRSGSPRRRSQPQDRPTPTQTAGPADVADLDLHALTLVAGVVLPRALDELADDEDPHALLEGAARVLGDAAPGRAAEEPVGDVLPLPVVLGAVADRDGEACKGRSGCSGARGRR
jgi:hypothetical protein